MMEREEFSTSENCVLNNIMQMQYVDAQLVGDSLGGDAEQVFIGVISGGSIKFSIGEKAYKVQSDEMFVLHGGAVAQGVKCSKAFKGYFAMVKAKFFTTLDVDTADFIAAEMVARTMRIFKLSPFYAGALNNLAARIIEVSHTPEVLLQDRVCLSLTEAYMYMAISVIGVKPLEEDENMRSNSSVVVMKRFTELLKDNYMHQRSVDYYAAQLGITSKYLSIVCRKHRGVTASRIIDGVIIRHAKMLLKQQGMSVNDVAVKLNFPSQSFFGKYFKQREGISPSRYKGDE